MIACGGGETLCSVGGITGAHMEISLPTHSAELVTLVPLQWSQALSIGFDEIDDDHRILLLMLADMADAKTFPGIRARFRELAAYLSEHFTNEEDFQRRHRYAGFGRHCQEHEELARRIKAIGRIQVPGLARRQPEAGGAALQGLIGACLVHHVMTADQALKGMFPDG